jgi:MFS family permease
MLFKRDPGQLGQLPDGATKMEEADSKVEIRQYSLREVTATRQFWIFSAIWFIIAFVTISILGHVAAHATDVGISRTTATTVLSMIGGASVIGRVGMGGISDRLGNKKTLFITLLTLTAALVLILFAREAWAFYLFALLQGISHGAAYTVISPLLAELFGLGSLGAILGVVVFIGTIGGAIGPILAGRTFDVTNGYQPFFLLSLGLSIAAIILLAFLKQTKMSNND